MIEAICDEMAALAKSPTDAFRISRRSDTRMISFLPHRLTSCRLLPMLFYQLAAETLTPHRSEPGGTAAGRGTRCE